MHTAPAITHSLSTLPLDLIDTEPQIRMRNGFDDQSIRELADSIQRNGLLQPILVTKTGDRYRVIAGHRRLAAMKFAGFEATPAIEANHADDEQAFEAQLAENIQREALTLADLADAVRMLHHIHGKADVIAGIVHKSKTWVSKHLALTAGDFPPLVRSLLDDGHTQDLEVLLGMRQVKQLDKSTKIYVKLIESLRAGTADRAAVRKAIEQLKAPRFDLDGPAEDDAGENESGDDTPGRIDVSFALTPELFAVFESVGGAAWVRRQLKRVV